MSANNHLTILGAGPAGLAVAYYAHKNTIPFTIYEASSSIGGNCVTYKHEDFLYDSGAHRFHNVDSDITNEIKSLLGANLQTVNAPSLIYHQGNFFSFPLEALDLLNKLGPLTSIKAGVELLIAKATIRSPQKNFKNFALHAYGKTIADKFLLSYSEKLWGTPCQNLSTSISGNRLKGLSLKTFLLKALLGKYYKVQHLESSTFYYPKKGYGMIVEELARFCGAANIFNNSTITRIIHDGVKIKAIEINNNKRLEVNNLISTLPLKLFLEILQPTPSPDILEAAAKLRYRNLILVVIFIDKTSITNAATIYFPDPEVPFTRIFEPKNRSSEMSPNDKTSIVAEIPCELNDKYWNMSDNELTILVKSKIEEFGLLKQEQIISSVVKKINFAYPILSVDSDHEVNKLFNYLNRFQNLTISGRNGKFLYTWLHDMMRFGREIIKQYVRM